MGRKRIDTVRDTEKEAEPTMEKEKEITCRVERICGRENTCRFGDKGKGLQTCT